MHVQVFLVNQTNLMWILLMELANKLFFNLNKSMLVQDSMINTKFMCKPFIS